MATTVPGGAVSRAQWERQYRDGAWDYLAGTDEAAHYLAIAELCRVHLAGARLLDVGCGAGILCGYLRRDAGIAPSCYTGIDIAQPAVELARASCPGAHIGRHDYSLGPVAGKFDGVIFNETLYYFADPAAILQQAVRCNLHAGGLLIVSMYGEHHAAIWDAVSASCDMVDQRVVENRQHVRWTVRAVRPR